jgi:hypothetical protein
MGEMQVKEQRISVPQWFITGKLIASTTRRRITSSAKQIFDLRLTNPSSEKQVVAQNTNPAPTTLPTKATAAPTICPYPNSDFPMAAPLDVAAEAGEVAELEPLELVVSAKHK